MSTSITGLLRGTTIELEDSVPEMDGKRVRVLLEPIDDEKRLTAEEQRDAWREWFERGPQGPIEDGEDTEDRDSVIQPGDIRWFRFQLPDKRRPVLVLGRDDVLPTLSQVPVIPLSTQLRNLPWEVRPSPADGLPADCVLKPEWIKSVDRTFLGPWIASLPADRWPEVRSALFDVLGL